MAQLTTRAARHRDLSDRRAEARLEHGCHPANHNRTRARAGQSRLGHLYDPAGYRLSAPDGGAVVVKAAGRWRDQPAADPIYPRVL
jgi:hypothetical protein